MVASEKRTFWQDSVVKLPLQHPKEISPATSLHDCIEEMQNHRIGCVFIVDEARKLVGIFTDRDVMSKYLSSSIPANTSVGSIMTKNPYSISSESTVEEAVRLFHEYHIRHLPVVDEGVITGLLSVRTLMDYLAEHMPGDVLNLPPDPTIVSTEMDGG